MEHTNVKAINIEEELKTSFLDYSMSVIVSRALPDVRDGMKRFIDVFCTLCISSKNYQ